MVTKVYVEGGYLGDPDQAWCRTLVRAVNEFAVKGAGLPAGVGMEVELGGSWEQSLQSLVGELRDFPESRPLLLIDSESEVGPPAGSEALPEHLTSSPHWDDTVCEFDRVHLMVRSMEAWFLAHRGALREVWGERLDESVLPGEGDAPSVAPSEAKAALQAASNNAGTRSYGARMQGALLGKVDPAVVRERCPWCDRFLAYVAELAGSV